MAKITEAYSPFLLEIKVNRKEFKKAQKQMIKFSPPIPLPLTDMVISNYQSYSLDTLPNSVPQSCIPAKAVSNNKEHNMSNNIYATAASVNSTIPTDQKQRDYTLGRLSDLKREKLDELQKTFGLADDDAPQSFTEFTARIKDGKFVFPKDRVDSYNSPMDILYIIRWRDPAVKEDEVGYRAAKTKLEEAHTQARDQVILGAADQGLKIIEDFKSLKLS